MYGAFRAMLQARLHQKRRADVLNATHLLMRRRHGRRKPYKKAAQLFERAGPADGFALCIAPQVSNGSGLH